MSTISNDEFDYNFKNGVDELVKLGLEISQSDGLIIYKGTIKGNQEDTKIGNAIEIINNYWAHDGNKKTY